MMDEMKIKQYAHDQGYDDIRKSPKHYKGNDVYIPKIDDGLFVGLPLVILVQGENIRMSTADEALSLCLWW